MDSLLEEINRKRKLLEENEITSNKKYYRRGDIIEQERQQIIKEREEKLNREKEKQKKQYQLADQQKDDQSNKKDVISLLPTDDISRDEVVKRLRARNAPVRLFGESDNDSCQRLKIIEMMEKEDNEGLRNDFQEALEKLENAYFPGCDDLNNEMERKDSRFKLYHVEMTINEMKNKINNINKGDLKLDCTLVLNFIKNMLNIWAEDLNHKLSQERINIKIRMEGARFEQTNFYLDPLMKMLQNMTLSPELMNSISQITYHCLDGNYVKANDVYLQMAIGNAPWPIGVTMVGIHARTGRERIFSRHVAHVLNDETQRKYIQGFKRLMTLCQRKFPSDPSKSVEFGGCS